MNHVVGIRETPRHIALLVNAGREGALTRAGSGPWRVKRDDGPIRFPYESAQKPIHIGIESDDLPSVIYDLSNRAQALAGSSSLHIDCNQFAVALAQESMIRAIRMESKPESCAAIVDRIGIGKYFSSCSRSLKSVT